MLNLVDLAGSERLGQSKASGDRQKETQAINKSLSALGDCITSLASGEHFLLSLVLCLHFSFFLVRPPLAPVPLTASPPLRTRRALSQRVLRPALASPAGKQHVPYRNSKLTHYLQPFLGGEAKALMFGTTSPSSLGTSLCPAALPPQN